MSNANRIPRNYRPLPRFAPLFRDRSHCRNVRFTTLGDCVSLAVCETRPLCSWADDVSPFLRGSSSFFCTDRVCSCNGCDDTFSTDELKRSRHTGSLVCAGCRAADEAADARHMELHNDGTGDVRGMVSL